jgi:GNAT superfamily N-acetyltransferase
MAPHDFDTVVLEIDADEFYVGNDEPDSFCYQFEGAITVESDGIREKAGTFSARYVDVEGATTQGFDTYSVFDSEKETEEFHDSLFEDNWFSPQVLRVIGSDEVPTTMNVLVVDIVNVLPKFRGRNIGLSAIVGVVRRFRLGAGLVVMKPYPLQFSSHYRQPDKKEEADLYEFQRFVGDQRRCEAKLRKHYAQLGFKRLGRTAFMILRGDEKLS